MLVPQYSQVMIISPNLGAIEPAAVWAFKDEAFGEPITRL